MQSGKPAGLENTRKPPKMIMLRMATTLISAIQNSVSPYALTLNKLIAVITTRQIRADSHWGTSGSQ